MYTVRINLNNAIKNRYGNTNKKFSGVPVNIACEFVLISRYYTKIFHWKNVCVFWCTYVCKMLHR